MEKKRAPSRREALDAIFSCWTPSPETESVSVSDALGRVLARNSIAVYSLPVVRASAMDGIAVASALFKDGVPDTSNWELERDYVRADTGDDFDDRFDAVIQIEAVTFKDGGGLELATDISLTPGMNVRPAGSSVKKGDLIMSAGMRLRPFDLAALTIGGLTEVEVIKKPVVAFIPTGSELVAPGAAPRRGQNIDSNSVLVKAMLEEAGAQPLLFPIVQDDPMALRTAIEAAASKADIILICGGSSKGGEDFNARLAEEMGEPILHYVASAPGRPMAAALLKGKPLINVPGPPPAAYFITDWCVTALVFHFLGIEPPLRKTVRAKLTAALPATPGMEILRRLELRKTEDGFEATPVGGRGGCTHVVLTASSQTVSDGGNAEQEAGDTIETEYLR